MEVVEVLFDKSNEGIYFACQLGIHSGKAIIEFAMEKGYPLNDEAWLSADHEWHWDEVMKAEQWLNDRTAEGSVWEYHPDWGDWGLWPVEPETD